MYLDKLLVITLKREIERERVREMSRISEVLNKTWTIIDENDDIINEEEEEDDINNNTKCILTSKTLSNTIHVKNSVFNRNNKENDLTIDLDKTINFEKIFQIDKDYYDKGIRVIERIIQRATVYSDLLGNEMFIEAIV